MPWSSVNAHTNRYKSRENSGTVNRICNGCQQRWFDPKDTSCGGWISIEPCPGCKAKQTEYDRKKYGLRGRS